MTEGTCAYCGAPVSLKLKRKYCSRRCVGLDQKKAVKVTCPCGTVFEAAASKAARGNKYCSAACYHKVGPGRRAEFVWVTCPCGVKFEARAWSLAHGRGKHCSKKCAGHFTARKADPPRPKNRATPEYMSRWRLAKAHGMTPADVAALIDKQDGRCYLCTEILPVKKQAIHIDHDHRCCPAGYSCERCRRGLACRRCNMLAGKVFDNPALLRLIAENLEKALASLDLEAESSKFSSVA